MKHKQVILLLMAAAMTASSMPVGIYAAEPSDTAQVLTAEENEEIEADIEIRTIPGAYLHELYIPVPEGVWKEDDVMLSTEGNYVFHITGPDEMEYTVKISASEENAFTEEYTLELGQSAGDITLPETYAFVGEMPDLSIPGTYTLHAAGYSEEGSDNKFTSVPVTVTVNKGIVTDEDIPAAPSVTAQWFEGITAGDVDYEGWTSCDPDAELFIGDNTVSVYIPIDEEQLTYYDYSGVTDEADRIVRDASVFVKKGTGENVVDHLDPPVLEDTEYVKDMTALNIDLPEGWTAVESGNLDLGENQIDLLYTPTEEELAENDYSSIMDADGNIPVTGTVKIIRNVLTPEEFVPVVDDIIWYEGICAGDIGLPEGWSVDDPEQELDTGDNEIAVTYTPEDGEEEYFDFSGVELSTAMAVTVLKADPECMESYEMEIDYGAHLSNIPLPHVDGGRYEWEDDLTVESDGTYYCDFVPDDEGHYNRIEGIPVSVTVTNRPSESDPTPVITPSDGGGTGTGTSTPVTDGGSGTGTGTTPGTTVPTVTPGISTGTEEGTSVLAPPNNTSLTDQESTAPPKVRDLTQNDIVIEGRKTTATVRTENDENNIETEETKTERKTRPETEKENEEITEEEIEEDLPVISSSVVTEIEDKTEENNKDDVNEEDPVPAEKENKGIGTFVKTLLCLFGAGIVIGGYAFWKKKNDDDSNDENNKDVNTEE